MTLILIALIAITVISTWAKTKLPWTSDFGSFGCAIISFLGFLSLFIYCFAAYFWTVAGYEKDIINREYQTNYTQEEVFYASSTIEIVNELNRKRIENNKDSVADE